MRKSEYKKRLDNLKKVASNIGQNTTSNKVQNQISNYQTRLGASGIDASKAIDKRNPIEKALNLPEDQNFLFDIFEVINRPQQALFGGIQNAIEGKDVLEGMGKGISGEQNYYFGDILRDLGVDDTELFKNPLSGDKVSLADILGLGGDIFLDPVDMPLMAAKPVNEAGKVLKGADAAQDAVGYAYKLDPLAAMTTKGSKSLLETGVGGLAKGTKKAITGTTKAAVNAADFRTVKKLAKESGLIADGTKVTKDMMPDLLEGLGKLGVDVPLKSEALESIKKAFKRNFNYADSMPNNLFERTRSNRNALDADKLYGEALIDNISENVNNYAKATGKETSKVLADINLLNESKYVGEGNLTYFIDDALAHGGESSIIRLNEEQADKLINKFNEFMKNNPNVTSDALRVEKVKNGVKIKGNRELLGIIHDDEYMMGQLANITFKNDHLLTKNEIKQLAIDNGIKINGKNINSNTVINDEIIPKITEALDKKGVNYTTWDDDVFSEIRNVRKLYEDDAEFAKLFDDSIKAYNDFADKGIKATTGGKVDYTDITKREGYGRQVKTDDYKDFNKQAKALGLEPSAYFGDAENFEGTARSFGLRTGDSVSIQKEKDIQSAIKTRKEAELSKIDNLKEKLVENRKAVLEEKKALNIAKQQERTSRYSENIKKLNKNKKWYQDKIKSYNSTLDSLDALVSDNIIKKAENITDKRLIKGLSGKTETYAKQYSRIGEIKAKLAQEGLSVDEIQKLQGKLDTLLEKAQKTKNDILIQTAKIEGSVDEKFLKKAKDIGDSIADNIKANTFGLEKSQESLNKELDKIKNIKQSFTDITMDLQKQQKNLELELQHLKGLSPEQIEKHNKYILDEIKKSENVVSFLSPAEGKQFFENNFLMGLDDFVHQSVKEAKAMQDYREILLLSGDNPEVIKFFDIGESAKKPVGMTLADGNFKKQVVDYLDKMKGLLPEDSEAIKSLKYKFKHSGNVYIDKSLKDLITTSSKIGDDEVNYALKAIDHASNLFKKTSTVSLGTQMRNITGNVTNMLVSDVPAKDMFKSYVKAGKLSKGDYVASLVIKNANGTLTAAEKADWKLINEFIKSGATNAGKNIRDIGDLLEKASKDGKSAKGLKKAWNKLFEVSGKANEKFDNLSRMALLNYASNNPEYLTKLGVNTPIQAIHHVLFDPQNLSPFEKKYMKRLIPFYTFTKQNLMFQAKNIMTNTTKYNRLMKTFNKIYEGVGEGNYRQYQKENFEIPLWKTEKGNVTLKSNLPVSDLGEYLENPLQRLVSSTNPLIKTPYEQVTGVDTFTGRDISDRSPLQAILDTTGLNNLTTKQIDKLSKLIDAGELNDETFANIFPSVFRINNSEKIQNQQQYEELMAYQEYIKALKNQGIDVPTIKELTSATNSSIKSIKNYRKRRSR